MDNVSRVYTRVIDTPLTDWLFLTERCICADGSRTTERRQRSLIVFLYYTVTT